MHIPFLLQPNIMITRSKTQRKRIMQNFKIQTSTTLIWFLSQMAYKISNDPDGDDFIVFILTAKKKERRRKGGRRDPWLQKPRPAHKKVISITASGRQTGYLHTREKSIYIFSARFSFHENVSEATGSIWETAAPESHLMKAYTHSLTGGSSDFHVMVWLTWWTRRNEMLTLTIRTVP